MSGVSFKIRFLRSHLVENRRKACRNVFVNYQAVVSLACEQAHLFGDFARLSCATILAGKAAICESASERNGASESEPARKPLYFEFRPLRGDKLPLSTKQSSNQSK